MAPNLGRYVMVSISPFGLFFHMFHFLCKALYQSCNKDLSRFGGALCKESIIGQKSVSTIHYTRPGTCIKHPLIESSLIFLILLFTKPNIEVSGWLNQTKTRFIHIVYQPFSRVSPPSFTLYVCDKSGNTKETAL